MSGGGGTKNSFQLAIFHLKVCFALSCIKVKSIKIKLVYSGISSISCSIYKVVTDHSITNEVHSVLEENEQ